MQLTRGIFVRPRGTVPEPPCEATFQWFTRPPGGTARCTFYTDGSRRDGHDARAARLGWAVIGLDERGVKVVEARGVPPGWVRDIPGAEAWALYQAGTIAEPGSAFKCDCKPCVDAVHNGPTWACAAHRPLARVNRLVHTALDDVEAEDVVWMPAHTKPTDVGVRELGDGQLLTERDRRGNALADANAKAAAERYRIPKAMVETEICRTRRAKEAARWLGRVSWLATNQEGPVRKDNDGSKEEAKRMAKARGEPPGGAARKRKGRGESREGGGGGSGGAAGHLLEKADSGRWACTRCLASGSWAAIVKRRCRGEATDRWREVALRRKKEETAWRTQADGEVVTVADPPPTARYRHQRMRSGKVVWCNLCGAYGENKAVKLALVCPGQVEDNHTGGQCLRALRRGRHPKTGAFLGTPVPEHLWFSGGGGNMEAAGAAAVEAAGPRRAGATGSSAWSKWLALRDRVRARERAAAGAARTPEVEGRATPVLALAGLKRDGGEAARDGSAGVSHASARWDALRRRVRAREEKAARKATTTECGGEVESGREGGKGEAAAGRQDWRKGDSVEYTPNNNLTLGNVTSPHNCNTGSPSGDHPMSMACRIDTSVEVDEGRESDQGLSTQVQGGSRLKESSGYPALRHLEPVTATAHAAELTWGVQRAGSNGPTMAMQLSTRGRAPTAAHRWQQGAAEGVVGMEVEGTVAMGPGTCGRAPNAARNGQQGEAEGVVSMVVEVPDGDDGGDCMQLD